MPRYNQYQAVFFNSVLLKKNRTGNEARGEAEHLGGGGGSPLPPPLDETLGVYIHTTGLYIHAALKSKRTYSTVAVALFPSLTACPFILLL